MRLLWFGSQRSKDIFRESVLQSLYLPVLNTNSTARRESWGDVSFWARVLPAQRVPFLMATDGSSGTLACLFFLTVGSTSITKCFTKGKKLYQFSPVVGVSIAQESMYFCSLLHKRPVTRRLLKPTCLFQGSRAASSLNWASCPLVLIKYLGQVLHADFTLFLICDLFLPFWVIRPPIVWERNLVFLNTDYYTGHLFNIIAGNLDMPRIKLLICLLARACKTIWFCILWIKLKAATEKQHIKKKIVATFCQQNTLFPENIFLLKTPSLKILA